MHERLDAAGSGAPGRTARRSSRCCGETPGSDNRGLSSTIGACVQSGSGRAVSTSASSDVHKVVNYPVNSPPNALSAGGFGGLTGFAWIWQGSGRLKGGDVARDALRVRLWAGDGPEFRSGARHQSSENASAS